MTENVNATPHALREAFYQLSMTKSIPDATALDDVIRRHPEFGAELTDFAIAIAVDALSSELEAETIDSVIDPTAISPAVSRAMSHFQNRLHAATIDETEAKHAHSGMVDAPNPFLGLSRSEYRAFAVRLNANTVFVGKLRDRQIDPATMTPGFQSLVADELDAPLDVIVAHFAAGQAAPSGQFFKAEGKPESGPQQSFEEAVRSSGLSEAQQKILLEL